MAASPKYLKVRHYIHDMVLRHTDVNQPLLPERQLGKQLGVAYMTVRKALKGLIEEGILVAHQGRGLFLNPHNYLNMYRFINVKKIMLLAENGRAMFTAPFPLNAFAHLYAEMAGRFNLVQSPTLFGDPGTETEEILTYLPHGIIWLRPAASLKKCIARLEKKIPVCTLAEIPGSSGFGVTVDYAAAGRLAAGWLAARGRRRLVFIGDSDPVGAEFLNGWRAGLAENGIPFSRQLVCSENEDIFATLTSGLKFDAVFTYLRYFPAVNAALRQLGQRNCDILVDGHNLAIPAAEIYQPPAARLVLYPDAMFAQAAENICSAIENPEFVRKEIVIAPQIAVME